MRVTVIPSDKAIGVDGRFLVFDFQADQGIHAIQWYGERGEMEFAGRRPNRPLTADDYQAEVKPFVDAWLAEAAQIDNPPPPAPEELAAARRAEILAELADIDRQSVRPLRAIAKGAAAAADLGGLVALEARAGELRAELKDKS